MVERTGEEKGGIQAVEYWRCRGKKGARRGDDEGTRPESYPKFTSRASNVAPAGALHLKRLLAIFMCTYVVIEREKDVKARNSEGLFPAVGRPKGIAARRNKTLQSLFR